MAIRPDQVRKIQFVASNLDLLMTLGIADSERGRRDAALLKALRRTSSYEEWAKARTTSSCPSSDAWR